MASITSWIRLEPRGRNAEMNTSLQARIYDPLWLMTRQWQLGEFQGEDNGSPVMSRWRGESGRLTRYHGGLLTPNSMVSGSSYDTRRTPLETMVERERVRPVADPIAVPEKLRLAAEAGQHFLRMLGQQPLSRDYRPAFVRHYPLPALTPGQRAGLDADSLSFVDLMAGRVADGRRLYADFHPAGGGGPVIPEALQIVPADLAEVKNAAGLWVGWYEALFSEPDAANASWLPERLEYAFSVGTRLGDGERVLTSPEYSEGRLDWYDFDLNPEGSLGGAADNAMTDVVGTAIPAPVSFRGMASPRFWEFEDAQVNFGAVDAGPTDLVRMLLVEFALAYGNDWFVIPVELPIGSLYRTHSLVITDTFGVRTLIQPSSVLPAPHSDWRMFQQSHTRGSGRPKPAANLFFLAPAVIKSLESAPVEEVLFLRDEMANLAWGVERLVESASEQPFNRFEAAEEKRRHSPEQAAPVTPPSGARRYRLSTEVPEYWVPLVPVRAGQGLRLRRGAVLKTDGTQQAVHAMGRLLTPDPGKPLELFEEEVPREGVRVSRNYQYTRWFDGSTHLWIGRRKQVGRGEGSSGLRFDGLGAT